MRHGRHAFARPHARAGRHAQTDGDCGANAHERRDVTPEQPGLYLMTFVSDVYRKTGTVLAERQVGEIHFFAQAGNDLIAREPFGKRERAFVRSVESRDSALAQRFHQFVFGIGYRLS